MFLITILQLGITQEALKDATFIIHAVPVQYSRKYLESIAPHVPKDTPIISTSKVRRLSIGFGWIAHRTLNNQRLKPSDFPMTD